MAGVFGVAQGISKKQGITEMDAGSLEAKAQPVHDFTSVLRGDPPLMSSLRLEGAVPGTWQQLCQLSISQKKSNCNCACIKSSPN